MLQIAGCMLIQPVERHMKKVVEEVTVDETLHLLKENQKDIGLKRMSQSNGDVEKSDNENRRGSKTLSHKEQNGEKMNKTEVNDQNGK